MNIHPLTMEISGAIDKFLVFFAFHEPAPLSVYASKVSWAHPVRITKANQRDTNTAPRESYIMRLGTDLIRPF